jgi:hypothetical protein
MLERRVDVLEALPARVASVEWQIVQLREEMRGEFAATRSLLDETRTLVEETRTLIREGDEETRRYMRVLYEDVISRMATIQEGRRPRR